MPARGLTPDRVVDAAAALADRDGPEALTLAAVAAEVGVRTPSLYNHVDGLGGLRRELTLRGITGLGDRLRRAAVGRAGEPAVRAVAAAYRQYAVEHPGLYALTVQAPPADDAELTAAAADVVEVVVAVLGHHGLEGDAAIHATRALRSALHGFTSLELAGGFGLAVDPDASFDWLVEIVVAGLEARDRGAG